MSDLGSEPVRRNTEHRLGEFTGAGYDKGRSWLWQAAWVAAQSVLLGAWWFPERYRPGLLRAFGADIGIGVRVRNGVRVHWPWKLRVGDYTWLGEGCWLLNLEPIDIGSNVCISQEAFLCAGSHQRHSETFDYDNGPITVGDSAWIATQAIVLRGVTIGDRAVVGARAVITHDLPADALVKPNDRV